MSCFCFLLVFSLIWSNPHVVFTFEVVEAIPSNDTWVIQISSESRVILLGLRMFVDSYSKVLYGEFIVMVCQANWVGANTIVANMYPSPIDVFPIYYCLEWANKISLNCYKFILALPFFEEGSFYLSNGIKESKYKITSKKG